MVDKKSVVNWLIGRLKFSDEIRFRLITSGKLSLIPIIALLTLMSLLWLILSINYTFFELSKLASVEVSKDLYFNYLIKSLMELIPYLLVFATFVLCSGIYIGNMFIRPFKQIGVYCRERVKNINAVYDLDFFTDLKLLTSFSEYFFNGIENALKRKKIEGLSIMQKFKKIHSPVFERNFFIHLFLVVGVIVIISGMGIYFICAETYMDLIRLSVGNIQMDKNMRIFFDRQNEIFLTVVWIVICIQSFAYIILCIRLYEYVAVPSFAIFSTMRSFLSGRFDSRVHIIGYKYTRGPFRDFNKYLDFVQQSCKK